MTRYDTGKRREYGFGIFKIISDLYMGPYLSPIKYGTTHDNYLKTIKIKLNKQNE